MKTISNDYKTNIKKYGKQIDSIITYNIDGTNYTLGKSQLNAVTPSYEGGILKSVMKQLVIDSNVEIPLETIINYQFGVLVGNNYEYINYGNYIVYKVEKKEDTNSYEITCYDKMLYSMKDYQNMGITYPITIRDFITELARFIQLDFANSDDTFANYDKQITKELYLKEDGTTLSYTFRDVLDELAQVTASTICINNDDQLEIRYINNTNETINEQSLKDINVNFGEKYGPINSIVLTRAGNSDSIYLRDDESIEENGLCEIKIQDNQIMNDNDRDEYLPAILQQLDGFEYYINDYSSTGITYFELCDKYNIQVGNNTYSCVMFNDEVNVTQGLEELIHTDMPEESETDYTKADKTDRKINQTYIIVDKQQGEIEALASATTTIQDQMHNMYTIDQVNQLLIDAKNGITNTFSEAGGNNVFRNTGLWFENVGGYDANTLFPSTTLYPNTTLYPIGVSPYEFWVGIVERMPEDKAHNRNALLLQATTVYQEQQVPIGTYTVSFKYKKLKELATCNVIINDTQYELTETDDTEFVEIIEANSQVIKVVFASDSDDACEIYDLMVNAGEVKLAYSQNQNETTTDTVNISKGITITSTDIPTTFRANADGVRIYANSDLVNPKTKFTDKGMETFEIEVSGKSEISGILIQEAGDQTWLTKI